MTRFLDLNTGVIQFEDGHTIKKNDSIEYIRNLNLGSEQKENNMKNGYAWLYERGIKFKEKYIGMSFCFYNNKLLRIDFYVANKYPVDEISTEEAYSEEYARRKYEEYQRWFLENIGQPDYYDWGRASPYCYEAHGWQSGIVIDYLKTKRLPNETMLDWEKRTAKPR